MMKLSFITDEATQSLQEAISLAVANGLDGLELRSVEDSPIDLVPPETLRIWKAQIADAGLEVCNLASSFFKCALADAQKELPKLRRLCDAAEILGCRTIRGFAFFAPPEGPSISQETIAAFQAPIALLRSRGMKLLLEADPSVNTTNHRALARLLAQLEAPEVGAIYDPGNDLYDPLGEVPYPDGYRFISPWLSHVHIKDAILSPGGEPECVCIGQGNVDYPSLLAALKADGYCGYLSLETHYRKNMTLTQEQMRLPQGSQFSLGGMAATQESITALKALLQEVEA